MYLHDLGRSGYNPNETAINPSSVGTLKPRWIRQVSGSFVISTQPVVSGGIVYWGSWDGYEHATSLSNPTTDIWTDYLGLTVDNNCSPPQVGVGSTATIASTNISGTTRLVLFVGGGNGTFYALDAHTGHIIWSTPLGSTSQGYFLWSSPAVFNGNVYMGVSSFGDCPLIRGEVVRLKASNGALQNVWYAVPNGCVGGGVWGSITIDSAAGTLFFGTGTLDPSCSTYEIYAQAVVELRVYNLSLVASWQPPPQELLENGDFGATPALFTAKIGGTVQKMVGLANKGGIYYAFNRNNLAAGPMWQTPPLATDGRTQANSAWDGTNLYVAAGTTTIGGMNCQGSMRALNPINGTFLWEACLNGGDGPVWGTVAVVPGLAFAADGSALFGVGTTATPTNIPGQVLFDYQDTMSYRWFFAGLSISNGVLYAPNQDGRLFAFTPNGL